MATERHTNPAPLSFKAAFCECFRCPAQAFEERLLRRCLPPESRPPATVVRLLSPSFFRQDLEYLGRIGETTTWLEFSSLVNRIRHNPDLNRGLVRKGLHLRMSGIRLFRVYEQITARRRESFL